MSNRLIALSLCRLTTTSLTCYVPHWPNFNHYISFKCHSILSITQKPQLEAYHIILYHTMDSSYLELQLPGFRFHPTEEELLEFYLKNMVLKKNAHHDIIGYVDIYRHDPWDLPNMSKIGEREWYFFVPRDRKHGSGGRPNRTTENGFWKATGSDRKIFGLSDPKKHLGLKKTLVFYKGRAPRGSKTDWVMNEYRLPDSYSFGKEIVLCKIYRKATSMKVLEQRAALEEDTKALKVSSPLSPEETASFNTQSDYVTSLMPPLATPTESCHMASENDECHQDLLLMLDENLKEESSPPHVPLVESCQMASQNRDALCHDLFHMLDEDVKQEPDIVIDVTDGICDSNNNKIVNMVTSLKLPIDTESLHVLQMPKMNMDWTQDAFWTQLCSPWLLDNVMLTSPYANVLNF